MDTLRQLALEMHTLSDIQDFLNDMIERRYRYECNLIASYSSGVPHSCIEKRNLQQEAVDSFMADLRSLVDLGVFPDGEVPEYTRFNIIEAAVYIMGRAVQGEGYYDYPPRNPDTSVPLPQPDDEISSAEIEEIHAETGTLPYVPGRQPIIHFNPGRRARTALPKSPLSPMFPLSLRVPAFQRPPPVALL